MDILQILYAQIRKEALLIVIYPFYISFKILDYFEWTKAIVLSFFPMVGKNSFEFEPLF